MGARLFLASSLSKIHPGAGRAPGVVDLPVVRDPLGIWYIPGSQLKGSIKSLLLNNKKDSNNLVECLLGPEVTGAGGASALAFTDLYPLLAPAPSNRHGIIYVTGNPLLARAYQTVEATSGGDLASILNDILKCSYNNENIIIGAEESGDIYVNGRHLIYKPCQSTNLEEIEKLQDVLGGLNALYKSVPLKGRILVVRDEILTSIFDSILIRQTRVRLDRLTKTVQHGPWTEEYIPWGTVFIGAVVDTGFRNKKCDNINNIINSFTELLGDEGTVVVGGKETVGAGLLKFKIMK